MFIHHGTPQKRQIECALGSRRAPGSMGAARGVNATAVVQVRGGTHGCPSAERQRRHSVTRVSTKARHLAEGSRAACLTAPFLAE